MVNVAELEKDVVKGFTNTASKELSNTRVSSTGLISGVGGTVKSIGGKAYSALMFSPLIAMGLSFIGGKVPEKWGWKAPLEKVTGKIGVLDAPLSGVSDAVGKNFNQTTSGIVSGASNSITQFANNTIGQSKIGNNALKRLSQNSLSTTIMGVTSVVGSSAAMLNSFNGQIKTLKLLHKELTGKSISTFKLIMGGKDIHPLVAQARKECFSGKSLLGYTAQTAGIIFNTYTWLFAKNSSSGFKGNLKQMGMQMGVMMGTNMLADGLRAGHTGLPSFLTANQLAEQGGQIPLQTYAGMIGGLVKNIKADAVDELAKKCFEAQSSPSETLKNISATFYKGAPIGAATAKLNMQKAQQNAAKQFAMA